ncbi:MAG: hypothetical protein ACFFG0_30285 [Candidatus Thorarchaeota archaeon]
MTIFNDLDLILLKEYFYDEKSSEFKGVTNFIEKLINEDLFSIFEELAKSKKCKKSYADYFINKQEFFDKALELSNYDMKVK